MADERETRPTGAFVLALLGGLWMIAASVLWGSGWGMGWMHRGRMPHHYDQPDGGGWRWMHERGLADGLAPEYAWWPWIGVAAGVVVVLGAAMVYSRPEQRMGWAVAILVAAVVGLFMGTGGLLGAILAIVGGVLALTWRAPRETSRAP